MEKKVKFLSIISIILLILFIVTMILAAAMSVSGNEGNLFNIMYNVSQVLMYISPVTFIVSFGLGIYCIVERRNAKKTKKEKTSNVKFPTVWFAVSSVIFALIIVFIVLVLNMEQV